MLVRELIDSTTKQWDWEKIFDLFDLSGRYTRDVLMWKEIRSHVFSVKFVYQVALQLKDQLYAEHFTAGSDWPA